MNDKKNKTNEMGTKNTGLCIAPDCLSAFFPGCRTRFHLFPENVKRRKKWLNSLNLKPKDLYAGARICYLHFDPSCYTSSNPKNTLRPCAVPTAKWNWHYEDNCSDAESIDIEKELEKISDVSSLNEDDISDFEFNGEISSADDDEVKENNSKAKKRARKATSKPKTGKTSNLMKESESGATIKMEMDYFEETGVDEREEEVENVLTHVCRTCLATGCKMYSMKQYNLEQTYLLLCGVTAIVFDEKKMPQMVCYECDRRLKNFMEFREKTYRAWSVLKQLIDQNRLTMADVKSIDRHETLLASNLVYTLYDPNHYDIKGHEVENQCIYVKATDLTQPEEIDIDFDGDMNYVEVEQIKESDDESDQLELKNEDNSKTKQDLRLEKKCSVKAKKKLKESDDKNDKWVLENEDNSKTKQVLRVEKKNSVKAKKRKKESDDESDEDNSKTKQDLRLKRKCSVKAEKREKESDNESDHWELENEDNSKTKQGLRVEKKSSVKAEKGNIKTLLDNMFIVKTMTPEEQREEVVNRKNSLSYKNARYRCDQCFRGYQFEKPFNNHMKRHTNESGELVCDICQFHFHKRTRLVIHISKAHNRYLTCKKCPFGTTLELTALCHKNYHDGLRFQCPSCPKHYAKQSNCVDHIRRVHPEDIICHLCGISLAKIRDLDQHLRHVHKAEDLYLRPPTKSSKFGTVQRKQVSEYTAVSYASTLPESSALCDTCDIRFRSEEALQMHLSQAPTHGHPPIYKPPGKGQRQRRRLYCKESKNINKTKTSYTCEQCGDIFRTLRAYSYHFKTDHPGETSDLLPNRAQFMCEICGKSYVTPYLLKDHLGVHTGERPHKCHECHKSFPTKARLTAHEADHRKSLACPVCGKVFSSVANRYKHIRIHSTKPYECTTCNKRFVTPSDKRNHIRHAHMGVPWPKKKPKGAPRLRQRVDQVKSELGSELMRAEQLR